MDALTVFAVVCATIAGAEFLDRTNFALLSLAAREPPLPVWIGAAGAFLATTGLSVVVGELAITFLDPEIWIVRLAGGLLLLGYAAYLVLGAPEAPGAARAGRSALTTAFLMIFLLELGDTTMILTITFAAAYGNALLVGAAAALGLLFVAATACLLGPRVGARVEPRVLTRGVAVVLAVVGTLTLLYALDPGAFSSLSLG